MTNFYIQTWGCQMNVYDSCRIRDLLIKEGFNETADIKQGDIVVLVTCAIREKAEDKIFNQLHAWKAHGEYKDNAIICVGGCVASEEGLNVIKKAPMVSIVFGPQTIHRLPAMIHEFQETGVQKVDVSFPDAEKFNFLPPPKASSSASAFVTIMEGCSNFCSYCIVPYTRGKEISRPSGDVIDEIKVLRDQGVKEINLLGQNVNSYCGVNPDSSPCSFAELLYEVAAVQGIDRIRFTTSNPQDLSDETIQAYKDLPALASALHLPVQHGSDRILKLMNRKYTRAKYIELVHKIRDARPNISLTSDFIVGFPGETEDDFQELLSLVNELRFDQSFSFIYSPRPHTKAALLEDDTPLTVKKDRIYRLQAVINNLAQQYSREMLNSEQKVLIEGLSIKDIAELRGRTENNRIVNFSGDPKLIGTVQDVKITDVLPHSLRGILIEK